MKQSRRPGPGPCRPGSGALRPGLVLLSFLGGVSGSLAQGVLTPPSQIYERPASSYSLNTNVSGGIPPLAGAVVQAPGLFQWGPLDFHPHLLYRFIYGDGIPSGPTNHYKTVIQEISPGLMVNMGDHWSLNYTPTVRLYSNNHFPDFTDELVALSGKTTYQDWGFGLSQTYASSFGPIVETESLTAQQNYMTMLQVSRQLGSQLSAEVGVNQNFRFASIGSGSEDIREWSVNPGLNYQFRPRFGVGLDGALGYDAITPGSDMSFEQAQGTMNWQAGDKVILTAGGGLEVRQLLGAELINPIYNGTITYRPWDDTAASLSARRTVTPSFYGDEVLVSTTVSATLRQEFLRHFNLQVTGGYGTTPFVGFATTTELLFPNQIGSPAVQAHVQQNRTDNTRYARVSLGSTFRQRGTVSIFYYYSETTSGLAAFALTSTQVGIEIGWRY